MGIERLDTEKRLERVLRGFCLFDAPVSIAATYDRALIGGDIAPFVCSEVTNARVNAAWSRGLGCVINSQGIMQSPGVREHARIPEDQVIMICLAMGCPNENFPAIGVLARRTSVEEAGRFIGFDQVSGAWRLAAPVLKDVFSWSRA